MFSKAARSQAAKPFRIGVLNDQSASTAVASGKGTIAAIELAIEDFGGSVLGRPIELISADHQNKVDVATSVAREWLDVRGVEAIIDLQNSAVALAVIPLVQKANKVAIACTVSSTDVSGKACTPISFHWIYDNYALARVMPKTVVGQGKKKWFLLNPDYAAGISIERELIKALGEYGATVVGKTRHPLGATEFSSVLLTAQHSGAEVIQIGAASSDLVNEVRQVKEFGIDHDHLIATTAMSIVDVHSLGLEATSGLLASEAFYWDLDDKTRAWTKRFVKKMGIPATMWQAGNYSAALHYLKSVAAAGTSEGLKVAQAMKSALIDDMMGTNIKIRADGRVVRDMHLFRVKTPKESKYAFDYYERIATAPGSELVVPVSESECALIRS